MKRMVLITIGAIIAGKLFASFMYKVAETTVQVPVVQRFLPKSVNDVARSGIPGSTVHTIATPKAEFHPFVTPPIMAEPKDTTQAVAEGGAPLDAPKKKKKKKQPQIAKATTANPYVYQRPSFQVVNPKQDEQTPAYSGGGFFKPSTLSTLSGPANTSPVVNPAQPAAVDIAYWTNRLVHNPNNSDARQFFALYTTKQITEQQFYSVLGFMQKSPIQFSRELAVSMAGYEFKEGAFRILADEAQSEVNAQLRDKASQKIQTYDSGSHIDVLQAAITSGDVSEKIEAATFVRDVAAQYSTSSGDPKTLFEPFVAPLEAMAHDSNALTQQAAQSALAALTPLLNLTTVAQNPGGGTGNTGTVTTTGFGGTGTMFH